MKLTDRQKKFVHEIIAGSTQEAAYAKIYPKSAAWSRSVRNSTASRMLHQEVVWAYYNDLKKEIDDKTLEDVKEQAIWTKKKSAETLKLVISMAVQDVRDAKERVENGSKERIMNSQTANAIIKAVTALNDLLNLNKSDEKAVTEELCIIDDYGADNER